MRSGAVITGNLKEFDPLDHVTLMIGGTETKIPMSEVAYLNQADFPNEKTAVLTDSCEVIQNTMSYDNLQNYRGLLIKKGNNVFVYSDNRQSSKAGADEIKRLLRKDRFWNVVDDISLAHFTINYITEFRKRDSAQLSISSWRNSNFFLLAVNKAFQLESESTNVSVAFNMYHEAIVPLQTKIAKGKVPKIMKDKFTIK